MWPGRGKKKDVVAGWRYLPVERVRARDEDPPQDLCASVATSGLIQPLLVTPHGEGFVVLEGKRRFQAARRAGMARVPAVVIDLSPEAAAEVRRWHPELDLPAPVATGRVAALLEEARRRGIIDGREANRLGSKEEGEVFAVLTDIWRTKKAGGVATIVPQEPGDASSGGAEIAEPEDAEPSASEASPSPELPPAGEQRAAPSRRGRAAEERQAVERVEQFFASASVRGRINGPEAERIVQLILKNRQNDPHAFLDWRNGLPLEPVARNAMLVAKMSLHMAQGLKWTRLQVLRMGVAGLLHNVGLAALGWKPGLAEGPAAPEPITHVDAGARLIQEARTWGFQVQSVCLDHHERWNGSGEPRHKTGEEVDLPTRMIALFDTFALLVNPWHGEGIAPREAFARVEAMAAAEQLFDPTVCRAFAAHFSKYPVGSVLKLADGAIARVVAANPSDPARPRLRVMEPEAQRDRFLDLEPGENACEDLSLTWEPQA
jgi:hypothetical protein